MDIKNLFTAGGVVMWPLLLSSVLAVGLIVERIKFWVTISTRQQLVFRNVLNLYRHNNVVSTIDTLRKNADLPMARIFLTALELEEPNPEEFRLALESEAQAEIALFKRFNTINF
jgi:biopolymer transport protein ExbB